MPNTNPNRVNSGKAGAGRYDFKRNSEAEIDLADESSPAAAPVEAPSRSAVLKAQMRELAKAQSDDVLAEALNTLRAKKDKTDVDYAALSELNLESVTRNINAAKSLRNESLIERAASISEDEYAKLKPSEVHVRNAAYDELVDRGVINDGDEVPAPKPKAPKSADLNNQLKSMVSELSDQDLVFSVNTLDKKEGRTEAEHRLYETVVEDHYNRCREAAKETPTSALETAAAKGSTDDAYMAMSRSETNAYHAAYDELVEREIEKKKALKN